MSFSQELTKYMNKLNCSQQEICTVSGVSPTLLSRYINDKRIPKANSKYLNQIIDALYQIGLDKKIDLSREEISDTLTNSICNTNYDYNAIADKLCILLDLLKISSTDLSKAIGYDPSLISRIKNKERRPADIDAFIGSLYDYIVSISSDISKKEKITSVIKSSASIEVPSTAFRKYFFEWMLSSPHENNLTNIETFLYKLDTFKLEDYVSKDFNKIKIPTSPVIFKNSKTYFGSTGRKKAEAEFIKTTLISKSEDPIFYYNNMPIEKIATDTDFKDKWILAITLLLKKGLHLNMIHDIDRPISELLLGLEGWIPVYMTGSISPYYFESKPSNFIHESHCVSGSVALSGEYIADGATQSTFYLTTKKEELCYAKEKAKYYLSKAKPLMKIYKENNRVEYETFLKDLENYGYTAVKKSNFNNIDFLVSKKCIIINKRNTPEIHFVIFNKKLVSALKTFLDI